MRFNRLIIATAAALAFAQGATGAAAAAGGATVSSPTVLPNPDEQILAVSSSLTHAGRPVVQTVRPNPDEQVLIDAPKQPIAGTPAVIVRVTNTKIGFDWGDAGIGAASALGLSLIALTSWLAVSHRRARRTGSAAATH